MEYARGPLFLPALLGLYFIYAGGLIVLFCVRRRHIPASYPKIVLIMQPVILGVAIPVQLLNPGWLMLFPAYMICLVLAFLFFQNVRVRSERAQLKQITEMVEHFACGMAICNIDKDGALDIQYLSGGLAAIYEMDAAELHARMRRDILSGVHPDDRAMVQANLADMGERRREHEMTYRYITDAGRLKWIHIHAEAATHADGTSTVYATYNFVIVI